MVWHNTGKLALPLGYLSTLTTGYLFMMVVTIFLIIMFEWSQWSQFSTLQSTNEKC